jgi:hypothetical protein
MKVILITTLKSFIVQVIKKFLRNCSLRQISCRDASGMPLQPSVMLANDYGTRQVLLGSCPYPQTLDLAVGTLGTKTQAYLP